MKNHAYFGIILMLTKWVESLSKRYYKVRWNYYKLRQLSLLQSATRFITNCDRYYKVRWIYYKLQQVLQSVIIITNCDSTPLRSSKIFGVFLNPSLRYTEVDSYPLPWIIAVFMLSTVADPGEGPPYFSTNRGQKMFLGDRSPPPAPAAADLTV